MSRRSGAAADEDNHSDTSPSLKSTIASGRTEILAHAAELRAVVEDGWRNVDAGELKARPPCAPTTEDGFRPKVALSCR
jgi:hypothetical protein